MSDSQRGAKLAPFATWRMRYFKFMLTLSPRGAILAPCGGANIISRTTAHRHVAPKNGEFKISIRHFGATWRHKFAIMAPLWQYSALAILWRQVAPNARHVAPFWRHVAPQSAHDLKYYTTTSLNKISIAYDRRIRLIEV